MGNDEKDMIDTEKVDAENKIEITAEENETMDAVASNNSEEGRNDDTADDKPVGYKKLASKKTKKPVQKKQREMINEEMKEIKEGREEANQKSCSSCPSPMSDCGKYLSYILIGLGFLLLYNIAMLWNTGDILETKLEAMEAAAIPLDITMTIITAADCEKCFSINNLVVQVGELNVNITEQKELASDSKEAQALIEGYQVKTLPAIILGFDPIMVMTTKGNAFMEQIAALGFENVDDETDYVPPSTGYIYQAATPPYYDVGDDDVKGFVTVISITAPDCEECLALGAMITALENALTIESVKEVEYGTAEAQEYIEKYALEAVPSIILSADAAVYNGFADAWETYGSVEDDGNFILRNNVPPYLDAATGEAQGLVDVIYLMDISCADCYNVTMHKTILRGFGIVLDEETTLDIADAEGQELLEKYSITKVPTIILSKDAGVYTLLNQVWEQVGEIAEDGSYIFTNMAQLQGAKYTDLNAELGAEETEASATSEGADEEASV